MSNQFLKVNVLLSAPRRPRGYVNVPGSVASALRVFVKRHGMPAAMDHFGLGRTAISSLASEQTVQAQTLAAAVDGLQRAEVIENEPDSAA